MLSFQQLRTFVDLSLHLHNGLLLSLLMCLQLTLLNLDVVLLAERLALDRSLGSFPELADKPMFFLTFF